MTTVNINNVVKFETSVAPVDIVGRFAASFKAVGLQDNELLLLTTEPTLPQVRYCYDPSTTYEEGETVRIRGALSTRFSLIGKIEQIFGDEMAFVVTLENGNTMLVQKHQLFKLDK